MAQARRTLSYESAARRLDLIARQAQRTLATDRLIQSESDFCQHLRELRATTGYERAMYRRCIPAQVVRLRVAKGKFSAAWLGELNAVRDIARPNMAVLEMVR